MEKKHEKPLVTVDLSQEDKKKVRKNLLQTVQSQVDKVSKIIADAKTKGDEPIWDIDDESRFVNFANIIGCCDFKENQVPKLREEMKNLPNDPNRLKEMYDTLSDSRITLIEKRILEGIISAKIAMLTNDFSYVQKAQFGGLCGEFIDKGNDGLKFKDKQLWYTTNVNSFRNSENSGNVGKFSVNSGVSFSESKNIGKALDHNTGGTGRLFEFSINSDKAFQGSENLGSVGNGSENSNEVGTLSTNKELSWYGSRNSDKAFQNSANSGNGMAEPFTSAELFGADVMKFSESLPNGILIKYFDGSYQNVNNPQYKVNDLERIPREEV